MLQSAYYGYAQILFNNNIRCIEINFGSSFMFFDFEFNNNIRCIEMYYLDNKDEIYKCLITT